MQRGRNRPVVKYHRMKWAHQYLKAPLTAPIFPIDATEGLSNLGMQGNDLWGDCVDAAEVHLEMTTATAAGDPFTPASDLAVTRYQAQTGATTPPGQGSDMASFALWGVKQGLWCAFAPADHTDLPTMCSLMAAGYGLLLGVNLTDDNETQFAAGQPFTGGSPDPDNGHCVLLGAAQSLQGPFKVATWALWWDAELDFLTDCLVNNPDGEAYLIVTTEEQLAAFEPQLIADVEELGGTVAPPAPVPPSTDSASEWRVWGDDLIAWAKRHVPL